MGCVVFTLLLRCIDCKLFKEVFVHPADQVFFLAEFLVADFVDLIHQHFDVFGFQISCGKGALHKASLQLFIAVSQSFQGRIQGHIQLRCGCVDDGGPAGRYRQIVGTVGKGGIIEEGIPNLFIIWIQPLFDQRLTKMLGAIFKFFANEAQKNKGQHHIALFKERTGIARLAQNIPALKEDRVQIQFFFGFLPCHGEYHPLTKLCK